MFRYTLRVHASHSQKEKSRKSEVVAQNASVIPPFPRQSAPGDFTFGAILALKIARGFLK